MDTIITDSYKPSTTQSYFGKANNDWMKHPRFAKRFREAAEEAKAPHTQAALGQYLGVSGPMAWNYLNGEKLPSMDTAIKISEKLGVCVEWLLTGRGPKRPSDIGKEDAESIVNVSDLSPDAQAAVKAVVRSFKKPESSAKEG